METQEPKPTSLSARRAWIEIAEIDSARLVNGGSLSARRAWIEMPKSILPDLSMAVALRKESVDRNVNLRVLDGSKSVALRKESVDRNFYRSGYFCFSRRRSPQGERG